MVIRRLFPAVLVLLLALGLSTTSGHANSQTYAFSLVRENVDVYWQEDGTLSLAYEFVFSNASYGSPIDYVDVGMPASSFSLSNVSATIDGLTITHVRDSEYVSNGVELGLGQNAIRPGQTGIVRFRADRIERVLFTDSSDSAYASAVFSPTWFDSSLIIGTTEMTVTFHLPEGIGPDEPRYHRAPPGWPAEPETGYDSQGRITYAWRNPTANGYTQYLFGASFPARVVPASSIRQPSILQRLGIDPEVLLTLAIFCGIGFFVFGIPVIAIVGERRRKLKYLPPKITLRGQGIKRGLTAIEAAILLEQPMDKILTMMLFAVIKKSAARVVSQNPLRIKSEPPLPTGLRNYETEFLAAMEENNAARRRKSLQETMIRLIRSVEGKMKGFSHRETTNYYKDIIERAWSEVEAAKTPQVLAEKYDDLMEWTMLDDNYGDHTREIFRNRPVPVPIWYDRYDPAVGSSTTGARTGRSTPSIRPTPGGAGLPHLPGSDFAASIVTGVQNFSSGVIGNLTDFTGGVTKTTNPPPVSSTSSYRSGGGGGSSCACACACAGCACACAGGGR